MAKKKSSLSSEGVNDTSELGWCFANDLPDEMLSTLTPAGDSAPDGVLQAAHQKMKKWAIDSTLTVSFWENRWHPLTDDVERIASEWTKHANLDFKFLGNSQSADIRISFNPGDGHWSALGTDSRNRFQFPQNSMNLALGATDSEETLRSIILHEFGHALGLIHEHQNPTGNIPWDEEAVYRWFWQRYKWDRDKTFNNVLRKFRYDRHLWTASEFDPESIMIYEIPGFLTGGRYTLKRQSKLSQRDIEIIRDVYPGRPTEQEERKPPKPTVADAVQIKVNGSAAEGEIGIVGEVDVYTFKASKRDSFEIETEGQTDVVMGLYGPDHFERQIAEDDDTGRATNAWIYEYLQPGTYYIKVWHHDSDGTGKYTISVKSSQS